MKRSSYLSLFGVVLAGCSAPATQSSDAAPTAAATVDGAVTPTMATAPSIVAPKPVVTKPAVAKVPIKAIPVKKAPKEAAPTKTYVVQKPGDLTLGPGAPQALLDQYRAEMAKVALAPPSLKTPLSAKPRLVLNTNQGPITVELDSKAAPLQVRSFVYLADKGFFDSTVFHRHADLTGDGNGFIIQGGDPLTKNPANSQFFGTGGPGYSIPREVNALTHEQLVIAAARSNDPDSAGSQFYITQGAVHFLDSGYTVFGKVVAGQAAALKLTQGDVIKNIKVEKK